MAKRESQSAQPKPGADSNPASLEPSFGSAIVQPKGFARGTVDILGCMAGDWDVRMKRNISAESTGEPSAAASAKKERY